ncbi:MAG: hypothetical protein R3230_00460 [Nitrosopumilaceae archaeon]|nr:hypothetical protein [Nitrosopumilaceae archaeon]
MRPFKQFLIDEKAPPSKAAEDWIMSNKSKFKDQYGDDWEEILFATAWKLFGNKESLDESEAPTNVTSGVANPDAPMFRKSRFAGYSCVEVDSDTYMRCSQGKKKHARWKGYVEDENLRDFVRKNFNKEKRLLMKDKKSGAMLFIK